MLGSDQMELDKVGMCDPTIEEFTEGMKDPDALKDLLGIPEEVVVMANKVRPYDTGFAEHLENIANSFRAMFQYVEKKYHSDLTK
jgi:hypothetical protein